MTILGQRGGCPTAAANEVRRMPPDEAASSATWLLLPPCLGEDAAELEKLGLSECFPPGSQWGAMAEDCCHSSHGPGGNPTCWDGHYTFERCCPQTAPNSALSAAAAVTAAPQLLCSGERLQGGARFVRQAGFDGERLWHPSTSFEASFDFASKAEQGAFLLIARQKCRSVVVRAFSRTGFFNPGAH
ncbi:unnamed protein product [Effrenium voratum]|uniref:Uncharacterized protein n=1 Tax=Effrenium voratum TaxID=2562239 RepID=A0AA36JPP3_9DINO|nr:unnamed protein product [Effrenium voratum]